MRCDILDLADSDRYESRLQPSPVRGDSVEIYLTKIGRRPLLTYAQERDLARRAKKGDETAKSRLVESNLKLVVSIAKVYSRCGIPLADLIQEGNIGLIHAVDSYDPERGFRFSTYAVAWIKQAITRAIERCGRVIRIPSYVMQSIRRVNKAVAVFQLQHGRDPSVDELSGILAIPQEKLMKLIQASETLVSLDENIEVDGTTPLLERLNDEGACDPEVDALKCEAAEVLHKLVAGLSPQEQLIIERRFGFSDGVGETLQEIGLRLKITRERVRQVEKRAIMKLRTAATRGWLDSYFQA